MNSTVCVDIKPSSIGTTFKNSISTDEMAESSERSKQFPDGDTQDICLLLAQNSHYSPLKCVHVPVDISNTDIVMDL